MFAQRTVSKERRHFGQEMQGVRTVYLHAGNLTIRLIDTPSEGSATSRAVQLAKLW
jgi:hypothetical protein